MSMGEAIALGIAKGVGQGYQKHFDEQRRERMDLRRMDKSFDMFKKQAQYSYGLEQIGKQNEVLGQWETVAKQNVNDIALQGATKLSQQFAAKDRPAFVRRTMKNMQGMSKAEMLSKFGYNKPDYSQWINDPDYQDAIPMSRIAGMPDMPGADEVFKYDPRMVQQETAAKAEKVTDYMRKREDEFKTISTMGVVSFGGAPSDSVKNFIWKSRPEGVNVTMKGSEAVSYDQNLMTSLINSGQVVKIGNQLKFKNELTDGEMQTLGIDPATVTGEDVTPTPLYTEPQSAEYIEKQEGEKMQKAVKSMSKDLGTGKGTPLTTYSELQDSLDMLNTMDKDALDYLFTVGFSNQTAREVAAKFGDKNAQLAKNLISKLSGTVNALRHDLYGSALTEGETAAFKQQFSDIGMLNNKENLATQIQNLMDKSQMGVAEKLAGYSVEQRRAFLEANPQYKDVMGKVEMVDTKQTLSDSSDKDSGGFTKEGVAAYVDGLIQSGQYSEEQRAELTQFMLSKANIK